jgi:TetR/AcrR family transcriptional regulator
MEQFDLRGQPPRVVTILESARRQFARHGFSKCTMEDIAADTGRGKASLYYYFPSKEAIFREVLASEQADFKQLAHAAIARESTAAGKITAYAEHRLEYFRTLMNLGKLSVQSFASVRSAVADLLEEFSAWERHVIECVLLEGIRSGEFAGIDPASTAATVLHAFHGLRLRAMSVGGDYQLSPGIYRSLLRETHLLVQLILRGILIRHENDVQLSHSPHLG